MSKITVGSLFSGIGGIELGLERTNGFETVFQVEKNEYAQKVLAKHWPHVARYGDIRTVGKHNLPAVDMLVGGFPCQPHSLAGKRKASGDARDLWGEFYRLICELKPAWVMAENVPGLLSSENGRFFGRVLRDLAACGYDAEWQVLSAAAVGAPHKRERIFLVAYSINTRRTDTRHIGTTEIPGWEESGREQSTNRIGRSSSGYDVSHAAGIRQQTQAVTAQKIQSIWGPETRITRSTWWRIEPNVVRVADGISARMDRIRGLGNAVVPQCAQFVGECILAAIGA